MFSSFFPNPKLFAISGVVWAIICVLFWMLAANEWEDPIGIAAVTGWDPGRVWLYQFNIICYGLFAGFWMRWAQHPWARWSVGGSAVIVFATWFQVQLDVMINEWFGTFYDMIQTALGEPNAVSSTDYYTQLATFLQIAMVYVVTAVVVAFFTSHYVFRWRTAMNGFKKTPCSSRGSWKVWVRV